MLVCRDPTYDHECANGSSYSVDVFVRGKKVVPWKKEDTKLEVRKIQKGGFGKRASRGTTSHLLYTPFRREIQAY